MKCKINVVNSDTVVGFNNRDYSGCIVSFVSIDGLHRAVTVRLHQNGNVIFEKSSVDFNTVYDFTIQDSINNTLDSTIQFVDAYSPYVSVDLQLDIPLSNIWNYVDFELELEIEKFESYRNNFRVFGYDIGNNRNINNVTGIVPYYNTEIPETVEDNKHNYSQRADDNCDIVYSGQNKPQFAWHSPEFCIVLYPTEMASDIPIISNKHGLITNYESLAQTVGILIGTHTYIIIDSDITTLSIEALDLNTFSLVQVAVSTTHSFDNGVHTYTLNHVTDFNGTHIPTGTVISILESVYMDYYNAVLPDDLNVISGVQAEVRNRLLPIPNDYSKGKHSDFIAYRHPYYNTIYLFNSQSMIDPELDNFYEIICDSTNTVVDTFNFNNGATCKKNTVCVSRTVNGQVSKRLVEKTNLTFNHYLMIEGAAECTDSCIVVDNATGVLNMDLSILSKFWRDDSIIYPFNQIDILWELIDYTGSVVQSETYQFVANEWTGTEWIMNNFNPDNYVFNFNTPVRGQYVVKYTLSINETINGTLTPFILCTDSELINGHVHHLLLSKTCNTIVVKNLTTANMPFVVTGVDSQYQFNNIVISETLLPTASRDIVLPTDGIYKIEIDNAIYYFISTCKFNQCMLNLIKSLACGCIDARCKETRFYDINALMLQFQTYISLISSRNPNFNINTDSVIRDVELLNIPDIAKIFERLVEYCNECDTAPSNCISCK